MAQKETAEQKLLKMIEASSGGAVTGAKTQQKVAKKQNILTIIKTSNLVLLFVGIGSVLLVLNEINSGTRRLGGRVQFSVEGGAVKRVMNPESLVPAVQRLSFYLTGVNRRNIFLPFEEVAAKTGSENGKNLKASEEIKKLKLVGVSWLDSVDSASIMIEDTEKQTTYFLKKGEKLGDIIVKTIYADSALLGYDNEEIILKYDKSQM